MGLQVNIVVRRGKDQLSSHPLDLGQYVIGRDPACEICIEDEDASRQHARLTVSADQTLLEDLNSANGTFVNGALLRQPTVLRPFQQIRIGATILELLTTPKAVSAPKSVSTRSSALATLAEARKYAVGKMVAKGGMGGISEAKDLKIKRVVAMKTMLAGKKAGEEHVARFVKEAEVTGQLEHPSIVPIYDLGVNDQGEVFYTMKFVKGVTLKEILEKLKAGDALTIHKYPLVNLLTIFLKACDALAFAHSKGVVHRDLKPENIMIGGFGEVLVMDWGLAKVLSHQEEGREKSEGSNENNLPSLLTPPSSQITPPPSPLTLQQASQTLEGTIMGTPVFMAPEQARGHIGEIDERTDIYSLGAILFNILTLHHPVSGNGVNEILIKIVSGEIHPPTVYNPKQQQATSLLHCPNQTIPESLSAVVMKARALNRDDRYQTVTELQKDIEAHLGGYATTAEQASSLKLLWLFLKRHKTISIATLVIFFVITGFMIKVIASERAVRNERDRATKALADLRSTAPALVDAALQTVEHKNYDKALVQLNAALDFDPNLLAARLLRAEVLIAKKDYAAAKPELADYIRRKPTDHDVQELASICDKALKAREETLEISSAFVNIFFRRHEFALAESHVRSADQKLRLYNQQLKQAWPTKNIVVVLDRDGKLVLDLAEKESISDLTPLRGIPLNKFKTWKFKFSELGPLEGMPLEELNVAGSPIQDLTPLRNMQLKRLEIGATGVTDLSLLRGMPLEELAVWATAVRDLSPLSGMRLRSLNIGATLVADLARISGMPLEELQMNDTAISDLTPLKDMNLKMLTFTPKRVNKGIEIIREMKSLNRIGRRKDLLMSAEEFWKKYDAGEFK